MDDQLITSLHNIVIRWIIVTLKRDQLIIYRCLITAQCQDDHRLVSIDTYLYHSRHIMSTV